MAGRDPERDPPAGFLGRWSARKHAARHQEVVPPPASAVPEASDGETTAPQQAEREWLDSLPDLDSLGPGSDFRPFMQKGVPARLRTAALRKLWRTNPVLANLDGLNDYDTDYTDRATVVRDLRTAYQVGRGFLNTSPSAPAEVAGVAEVEMVEPEEQSAPDPAAGGHSPERKG